MLAREGSDLELPRIYRLFGKYTFLKHLLTVGIFFVFAGSLPSGCSPKIVRVPVSIEDILRANTASKEGDIAFARKDYYAALIKYLEAGRLNPNSELFFNKIGIAYSQLQYYIEATEAFQRSIGLNPKYAYSFNNLGAVYFAQKNLKKAEKNFKKAIKADSEVASFHINLGTLYFEKKKFDQTMEEWRRGLKIDPLALSREDSINLTASSTKSYSMEKSYFVARLYASSGDAVNAVENLQEALKSGFTDIKSIQEEPDFDPIRQDERFIEFMKIATLLLNSPNNS